MKREFLKELGLADDVIDKVMAENGKDIEAIKDKLDAREKELATAQHTIQQLQDTVRKYDGVDVQKLKDEVAAWEKKYNEDLGRLKLESAMETALMSARAKNTKAVKALLNMEQIRLDGEKLLGLDEQLTELKKNEPYLFEDTRPGPTLNSGLGHGNPLESGSLDKFPSAAASAAGITRNPNNTTNGKEQ